ncbi:MAG: hypothetical protein WB699_02570 [Bacteroidota bacterium]
MKTIALLIFSLTVSSALAQEETLVGADVEHGGYGALVVKFSPVNNKLGILIGARGGWIINHTFALGIAGYGLANNVRATEVGEFGEPYVDFAYGGLDLEYIHNSNALVHYSVHALIGAGAVGHRRWGLDSDVWDENEWDRTHDVFFAFEPGVNLDLNVTTWFRASLGASYRLVSGSASTASSDKNLSGPSAMLTFRFGLF